MGRVNRWNKFGRLEVYEGLHGVAVGNEVDRYAVFGSKKGLKMYRRSYHYKGYHGYCGGGYSKRRASGLVKTMDNALEKPCDSVPVISVISPEGKAIAAFILCNAETKGVVIVHEKGDMVGFLHEKAHYIAGHFNGKEFKRTLGLREEKKVVAMTIRLLRWEGLYTPEARDKVIKCFSTYIRGANALDIATKLVDEFEQ